ncbi:MAG: hypothetical protein RI886_895 [Pseudomonadota bacterium]
MKAILYIEGTNNGADFLKDYAEQEINLESLYKDIDVNSPPLANLTTSDNKVHSIQMMDVRFIDDFVFIHCYITDKDGNGGKALVRLKPIN